MAVTSLKDRVRAATTDTAKETPATTGAEQAPSPDPVVVEGATPEELHAAERAAGGQTADAVLAWLGRHGQHFTDALPSHIDTRAFLAAVRDALPGLVRCTPASLFQALLTCARFGLLPDGREAVIRRDGPLAVFVPRAQGYVELMHRSGHVASVRVGFVYAGDEWNYTPSAPPPLDFTHKPDLTASRKDRGQPILAYAFCWMASGARSQIVILTREDAEEIRDEYSDAYRRAEEAGTADSFWHTHFPDMWLKSAVRRLPKVVPMSAEVRQLALAEDAGDAGQLQVFHAPDEDRQLRADAEAAHRAAEGSQESFAPAPVRRRGHGAGGRKQPRRQLSRKSRKRGRRR